MIPSHALSFCFEDAERAYGVSQQLLRGIARVESNMYPAAVNKNSNGSADYGLMQVNSFWFKPLGTTAGELLKNPCYNVMAGAWILKGCLDRHGETWEAVGCYNATSRHKRVNYSWKVYRELLKGAKSSKAAVTSPPDPDKMVNQSTVPSVSTLEITVFDKN